MPKALRDVASSLALLHAPHYTSAEIQARRAYEKRWYGGGLYNGNYIPDLQTVQESVFKSSYLGPRIKDSLGMLLINTVPAGAEIGNSSAPQKKQPVIQIGN